MHFNMQDSFLRSLFVVFKSFIFNVSSTSNVVPVRQVTNVMPVRQVTNAAS